jgi:hypothetical protein
MSKPRLEEAKADRNSLAFFYFIYASWMLQSGPPFDGDQTSPKNQRMCTPEASGLHACVN